MTLHWFTTHQGKDWDPAIHGYNQTFALQVRALRHYFELQPKAGQQGLELGQGSLKKYQLRGQIYYLQIHSLIWNKFRTVSSAQSVDLIKDTNYITPQFVINFTLYDHYQRKVFSDKPLVIEFGPRFPQEPPRYRIDNEKFRFNHSDSPIIRSHHIHRGGWLCIMGGGYRGYDSANWNPDTDTLVTGFNRSLEWIVWHLHQFGW